MIKWEKRIMRAQSLSALCEELNDMEDIFRDEADEAGVPTIVLAGLHENDLCALPTFGGDEPEDTQGIYSWDEDSFLVFEDQEWQIIDR